MNAHNYHQLATEVSSNIELYCYEINGSKEQSAV